MKPNHHCSPEITRLSQQCKTVITPHPVKLENFQTESKGKHTKIETIFLLCQKFSTHCNELRPP